MPKFPAETEQGDALPSCFSSDMMKKYSFQGLHVPHLPRFSVLWVTVLFKMSSNHSAEGPSRQL